MIEDNKYVVHGPSASKPIPNISLGLLVYESFLENCDKPQALVDVLSGESISYKEILGKTCSLAQSLLKNGYGRNTVISVSSENNLPFFIPVISALYVGAIVAPINHNYTTEELLHTLNTFKPRVIFCSEAVALKYVGLKNKLNFIEKIITIDSDKDIDGSETLDNFIAKTLGSQMLSYRFPITDISPREQIAFFMSSSGTTGLPKGVMQSHFNVMTRYMHTMDTQYTSKQETFLGLMPFFHAYGLVTTFFAIVLGQKIAVIKRFEEELFLKSVQNYKISTLYLAPPLVLFMAKSPLVDKYDISCVKEIACSAAALNKNTEEAVKKRLNLKTIRQAYGLTEATLAVIITPLDSQRHGSSGKVITYMSCKVRDPVTGKSLGPGQVGELCFKGAMVTKGYYGNEEATRNIFTSDGWLLTGDLGYYDEDEYFYIVDRLKELIKYKAFQVAPAELEAILINHPKIKDAGVVGLPDEDAGELPLAFVVKNPNVILTEKEVINYVTEKVSSQKRLRGGVIFVSEIPKSPSGKILRKDLRKLLHKYKSKL